jgi:hypothetical protein
MMLSCREIVTKKSGSGGGGCGEQPRAQGDAAESGSSAVSVLQELYIKVPPIPVGYLSVNFRTTIIAVQGYKKSALFLH